MHLSNVWIVGVLSLSNFVKITTMSQKIHEGLSVFGTKYSYKDSENSLKIGRAYEF